MGYIDNNSTLKYKIMKYLSFMFLIFLKTSTLHAQPSDIITIQFINDRYQYIMTEARDMKYFYNIVGKAYVYEVAGKPAEDTKWNRKEIILALHDGLINRNFALDVKNMVKMKKKGWCVPTILVAKQEKGLPALVVDFITDKGFITGFITMGGLPCDNN